MEFALKSVVNFKLLSYVMVGSSTIRLPVVRTATETDGASQYLCHGRNLGITTLLTWRVLQLPFSNAEVVHSGSR